MKQTLEQFKQRPLSHSSLNSWEWNKEEWYDNYILGIKTTSKQLDFGKMIDLKIQNDLTFMPDLPRYPLMQHSMKVMFSGIPLIGIPDGLDLDKKILVDYKTGVKAWDNKRARETKQLDFYLLLLYITYKIKPEEFDCMIYWLQTVEHGDFSIQLKSETEFQTFKTRRTMLDISAKFGPYLKSTYALMCQYVKDHETL